MSTSTRRRSVILAVIAGLVAIVSGASFAYWGTKAAGTGTASAGTLNAPTAVGGNATTKLVSWTASSTAGSAVVPQSYLVERSSNSSPRSWSTACTAPSGSSCTDGAAIPSTAGTYSYVFRVTAIYKTWTAVSNESAVVNYTVVAAGVTVTGASPNTRAAGLANQDITISGSGFANGATATFSDSGITVVSTTVNSSTSVTARINIANGATAGTSNITVTNSAVNGGKSGSCTACFTVNAAPTITSPSSASTFSLKHGDTGTLTITGSGFASGINVVVDSHFTVNSVTVTDSSHLSVSITAVVNNKGTSDLTVTNTDGGTATAAGALINS
jgi:hypothetical protein